MGFHLNTSLALKIMVNSSVRSAQHEMAVHSAIDEAHPGRRYVIRLVDGFLLDKFPCLVFEPHGGELARHLRKQGPLAHEDVRSLARQMLLALDALHAAGFAHGDVKPGNILWDHESKEARLIDLGWARGRYKRGQSIATQDYCPPEMLLGLEMTTAIDLWGLGCTLFEALTGEVMFDPYATCETKYEEFDADWTNPVPSPEDEKEEPEPQLPFKLEEGLLLAERFQLRSMVGSGKTGEVWLADAVQTNHRSGQSLTPVEIRSEAKPDDASNDRRPSKLSVWEVVLGYEHFLLMQSHLGEYPPGLARKGKYHYILFGDDGELRFRPKIEHVSIAERLMKTSGMDSATAASFEEIIKPMLALDAAKRPTAAEMLRRLNA
jgi:serine/threonine protein kinase